ncbi:hypothetical protein F1559_004747 [Cyanidiococcus yangmingshanensis]|uniref:DUF819 family protein n=1 Tax=Cyanidiococcus yangmingshanensis TaxID=2690220 RepID=A0A7J7IPY0_9RHOD|nr:hypothetical protein F1559_004747 [Cyanidiococcus yangmingshanensis]
MQCNRFSPEAFILPIALDQRKVFILSSDEYRPRPTRSRGSGKKAFILRRQRVAGPCDHPHRAYRYRSRVSGAIGLQSSLVKPNDFWGVWSLLIGSATVGVWFERTRIGATLSAPLLSSIMGLLLVNLGILPVSAPAYQTVSKVIVPLAIPLLLFNADMRRVFRETGRLLNAFWVGALATLMGTFVACALVPPGAIGADNFYRAAVALNARHIGGSVNLVAVAEATQLSPGIVAALLAADNIVLAIYFPVIFALSSAAVASPADSAGSSRKGKREADLGALSLALSVSFGLCFLTYNIARWLHLESFVLPLLTLMIVLLATIFPKQFQPLQTPGTILGMFMMQIFFAVTGALGSITAVIRTAPLLLLLSAIQVIVHLLVVIWLGGWLGMSRNDLMLASNANIGGPSTAAGMAVSKGWEQLVVPAILIGVCGYATATFISLACLPLLPRFLRLLPWSSSLLGL